MWTSLHDSRQCFIQSTFVSIGSNGNYRCASGGRRQGALIYGGSVNNRLRGHSLSSCRSPQLPPEAASVGLVVSGGFSVPGPGETWPRNWRGKFELKPWLRCHRSEGGDAPEAAGGGLGAVGGGRGVWGAAERDPSQEV